MYKGKDLLKGSPTQIESGREHKGRSCKLLPLYASNAVGVVQIYQIVNG